MRQVLDAPAPAMPDAMPPRERLSILVVEDDALVRLTTLDMLADLGHDALGAGDAAVALEVLGRGPVDVLLTDVRLPGLSGRELADEARRRQPGLAIVMATGYSSFSRPGAVTLPKPYGRDGLERALAEAVGLVRQTN